MIKECQVVLNNEAVTVVKFDDVEVQIPSIGKDAKTVCIKFDNGCYSVVDHTDEPKTDEFLKEIKVPEKMNTGEKETIKMKKRESAKQ